MLHIVQQRPDQVRPRRNMGKISGPKRPQEGLCAGVGGTNADNMGTPFQKVNGNLNSKILFRLDHRTGFIKIVYQHPSAGVLLLEQAAVADKRGKIRTGGVIPDIN